MAMNTKQAVANAERVVLVQNGWVMLPIVVALLLADLALLIFSIGDEAFVTGQVRAVLIVAASLGLVVCVILLKGFFTLQPNEARVLVLFGSYKGTVRASGFHWGNPFYSNGPSLSVAAQLAAMQEKRIAPTGPADGRSLRRNKVSLRARTLNGGTLKVNDKRGNPVEIAAVVV